MSGRGIPAREIPPEVLARCRPGSPLLEIPLQNRKTPNQREHWMQRRLIEWVNDKGILEHPELQLLYAVPNGGARSKAQAGKLKAEGVKPGVPDLVLPVPRLKPLTLVRGGDYYWHGLYLELKVEGGRLRKSQKEFQELLRIYGHRVETVWDDWEQARDVLVNYLTTETINA